MPSVAITIGGVEVAGFISVSDIGPADVLAEPGFLPFRTGSLDQVAMVDVLDLAPRSDGFTLVREARRTLTSGGNLTVVVPNAKNTAWRVFRHGFARWEDSEIARRRGLVPASMWDFGAVVAAMTDSGLSAPQRLRRHSWGRQALAVVAGNT